jgi:hypothetical protein
VCKEIDFIESNLNDDMVAGLSNDTLQNRDTTYSLDHFNRCKNFDGPPDDKECKRFIPCTKFEQVPLIKKLVDTFSQMLPSLTIDLVWLIIMSKPGRGFQCWHRDFYLDEKIPKTVVINLVVMKKSDLLGRPTCVLINSDNKGNSDNEENVSVAKVNDRKPSHNVCPNNADNTDDLNNRPRDKWDPAWVWDADVDQRQVQGLLSSFRNYSIEEVWILKKKSRRMVWTRTYCTAVYIVTSVALMELE